MTVRASREGHPDERGTGDTHANCEQMSNRMCNQNEKARHETLMGTLMDITDTESEGGFAKVTHQIVCDLRLRSR